MEKSEKDNCKCKDYPVEEAHKLKSRDKKRREKHASQINGLWIWLGIIILVFILIWWLWTIGIFDNLESMIKG